MFFYYYYNCYAAACDETCLSETFKTKYNTDIYLDKTTGFPASARSSASFNKTVLLKHAFCYVESPPQERYKPVWCVCCEIYFERRSRVSFKLV